MSPEERTRDGSELAEEFLRVTQEIDAIPAVAKEKGARRAVLAQALILVFGVTRAAELVDTTVANLWELASRVPAERECS